MNQCKITPLVSVIIPVYNTSKYIGECFNSILKQSYKNIEIIFVDDGSKDNSLSIVKFYQQTYTNVYVFTQKNCGPSAARNVGLANAHGKYVCFLDSDDYFVTNAIEICVDKMERWSADVVLFNIEMFYPDGIHFPCYTGPLFSSKSNFLLSKENDICVNFTNAAASMIRKSVLDSNNIRFKEGMLYEDWCFMVDVMTSGNHRVYWHNDSLYWYRRNYSKSITSSNEFSLDLFKAYHIADGQLRNCGRTNQLFINDNKILSESLGYYRSKLLFSKDNALTLKFLQEITKTIASFSDTYLFFLSSYLNDDSRFIGSQIYKFVRKQKNTNPDLIERLNSAIKYRIFLRRINNKIKKICNSVTKKTISALKSSLKVIPSYRVICKNKALTIELFSQVMQLKKMNMLLFNRINLLEENLINQTNNRASLPDQFELDYEKYWKDNI